MTSITSYSHIHKMLAFMEHLQLLTEKVLKFLFCLLLSYKMSFHRANAFFSLLMGSIQTQQHVITGGQVNNIGGLGQSGSDFPGSFNSPELDDTSPRLGSCI